MNRTGLRGFVAAITVAIWIAMPCVVLGDESGLVLHYDFSAGSLTPDGHVKDASGNGNDGSLVGAALVPRGDGFAARFDKPMSYVQCAKPGFQSTNAMTVAFWFYMENMPLVGDAFVERAGSYSVIMDREAILHTALAGHRSRVEAGAIRPMGVWRHLAVVFDATGETTHVRTYDNGRFLPHRRMDATGAAVDTSIALRELGRGGALHLGWKKANTDPRDLPVIAIDDFRIYNRALSGEQVADLFRQTAVKQVEIKPYVYRFSDEVILGLHADALAPLPANAKANIALRRIGETKVLARNTAMLAADGLVTELPMSMKGMAVGDYEVDVAVVGANGERIARKSVTEFHWPKRPTWPGAEDARVLNALVTELMNISPARDIQDTYRFVNPRDGWVFISAATEKAGQGRLRITLDPSPSRRASPVVIEHDGSATAIEAMRHLPEGAYRLRMAAADGFDLSRLIVRAIPNLGDGFPMEPHSMQEYGSYGWPFMDEHLSAINIAYGTAAGHGKTDYGGGGEGFFAWKAKGRWSWAGGHMPSSADDQGVAPILKTLQSDDWDGTRLDEVGYPGHHAATAPALRYLKSKYPEIFAAGKSINIYTYGQGLMFQRTPERGAPELLEALKACNGHYIFEIYHPSYPDQATARAAMDASMISWLISARRAYPDPASLATMLFGCWMHPASNNSDMYADVDYKAYMELQVRATALHDACFGLRGLGIFAPHSIDEEAARWWGKLLRHYAIEGRTDRLWPGPYKMSHIQNPHFTDGLDHWSPAPAQSGSIFPSGAEQCGMLIKHWTQSSNRERLPGADVVVMRQSAKGANTLSQQIKGLKSGRLYSLRFTTADYADMVEAKKAGRPPTKTPTRNALISARIDGATVLPDKSFSPGTPHYPYRDDNEILHWRVVETGINFHRIVFRAESNTAQLTFTGQPSDGSENRESLLTWVSVRPYLDQ